MLEYLLKEHVVPIHERATASVLDLGTGNGSMLFRLREGDEDEDEDDNTENEDTEIQTGTQEKAHRRFGGIMLGVDYSQRSVELARRIALDKELGPDSSAPVSFETWDLINASPITILTKCPTGFDIVLDKGTFDAISLSDATDSQGRRICEGYKERVIPLVKDGGIFLVTSCNWTEEELKGWFDGGEFELVGSIAYKSFSFGGKKGQSVSSTCFRRRR